MGAGARWTDPGFDGKVRAGGRPRGPKTRGAPSLTKGKPIPRPPPMPQGRNFSDGDAGLRKRRFPAVSGTSP
jgi:hypothetical protein